MPGKHELHILAVGHQVQLDIEHGMHYEPSAVIKFPGVHFEQAVDEAHVWQY